MRIPTPYPRASTRIFVLGFLALSVGGIVSPTRLAAAQAQGPAPAAPAPNAQSATLQTDVSPGQVKKEETEEENIYRHTPLVQKLAKIFHLDVETTARLFEFINFAIILMAIVIPIGRFLPRVIRKRSTTLSHNLETARKTTADANARLSAVEAQLSRLDEEIAKIRAQVEEESKQDEARIRASIEEESARVVAAAEQEINMAAAHARRGLRHFAADLAIEQAVKQMVLTPEADRALIAEFVSEAQNGANGAANKGKN